jgi:DNA-binding GntR family transcriptional regulator
MSSMDPLEVVSLKPPLSRIGSRSRRRATMAQDAARDLRQQIVFGAIPPGATLRLEEVARSLDMSISPVREAIRQLEMMGLVEHVPYRGARVTPLESSEMRDVYEARLALETLAVRRAAERFDQTSDELVSAALAALKRAYEADDRRAIVEGNTAFHAALAVASGSWWLERLIRPTLETTERFGAALLRTERRTDAESVEERGHGEILEALRRHDPDAAEKALRAHLQVFEELFFEEVVKSLHAGDEPS